MHRRLLVLLLLGVIVANQPTPNAAAEPDVVFADAAERNVLLVPYERGMSQLTTQTLFQVRLTAGNTPARQQKQASRSPHWRPSR